MADYETKMAVLLDKFADLIDAITTAVQALDIDLDEPQPGSLNAYLRTLRKDA